MQPMQSETTLSKNRPMAILCLIALHTEVRSNVCVGSNVVINMEILNMATPSVYLKKTFRKILKVFLSD